MAKPGPAEGVAAKVTRDCLRNFPAAGSCTLANKLFRENPQLWKTENACYLMVRRLRGKQGKAHRRGNMAKPEADLREYDPSNQFKLPPGMKEIDDFKPYVINTPGWWLVLSDLHCPWHDVAAITECLRLGKKRKVVGIIINGDLSDGFGIGRWESDPRKRDYPAEVKSVRGTIGAISDAFPRAEKKIKLGNHDERLDVYMQTRAPALLGIPDFEFGAVMGADHYGYDIIKDKRPIKLGKLFVLHGHEYSSTPFGPVNPARGLYMKAKVSAMCGHLHRSSQHSEKDLAENVVSTWSTGCLCNLNPYYAPINTWNHGAALVHIGQQGEYEVDNFRIIDGKLWH